MVCLLGKAVQIQTPGRQVQIILQEDWTPQGTLQYCGQIHALQLRQSGDLAHHAAADHTGHAQAYPGHRDTLGFPRQLPDAAKNLLHNIHPGYRQVYPVKNFPCRVGQGTGKPPLLVAESHDAELPPVEGVQPGGAASRGLPHTRRDNPPLRKQLIHRFSHRHQGQPRPAAELRLCHGATGPEQRLHRLPIQYPQSLGLSHQVHVLASLS